MLSAISSRVYPYEAFPSLEHPAPSAHDTIANSHKG